MNALTFPAAAGSPDPMLLRVIDEMKRHFKVKARSYVDASSGRQVGTLWLPGWGTWVGDDEPTLDDASLCVLHGALDAWRARFPRIDISWNEYAEDGLTGVVVYVQRSRQDGQASVSRKWKELDLTSKVVGRPDQPDPVANEYAVTICKSQYGDWGSVRLATKTLVVKATSLEQALEVARGRLVADAKYRTRKLPNGDSVGWSLEIDTKLYAPRAPALVPNRISR